MKNYENLVIVVLEGDHDIALLYRVIKTINKNVNNISSKSIKEFPSPVSNILKGAIKNKMDASLESSIENLMPKPLPFYIIDFNSNLILLYGSGGKDKTDFIKKFLIQPYKDEFDGFDKVTLKLNFIFFLDADQNSINIRNNFFTDYSEILEIEKDDKESVLIPPNPNSKINKVGIYIFSDIDKKGSLETLILPLIEKSDPNLYNVSKEFVEKNYPVLKINQDKIAYELNRGKAIIGVAGQVSSTPKSGKSNTVIIKEADIIHDNILDKDINIQSIKEFFNKILE